MKQDAIPLSYTPRKFVAHPENHYFYLIEGDNRVYSDEVVAKRVEDLVGFHMVALPFGWLTTFASDARVKLWMTALSGYQQSSSDIL